MSLTYPTTTAVLTALVALLAIALSLRVSLTRRDTGIAVGADGPSVLLHRIRAHGNLVEHAPLFLLALALLEMAGCPPVFIAGLAVIFGAARIAHAVGLSSPATRRVPQRLGAVLSVVTSAVVATVLLSVTLGIGAMP